MEIINDPTLIEPSTNMFIKDALKQCNMYKKDYYNYIINTGIAITIFTVLGIVIYYSYKPRIITEEQRKKDRQQREDLMRRLNNIRPNTFTSYDNIDNVNFL